MSSKTDEEKKVDAAVEATFPASDAPAHGKDVGPDPLANFDAVIEKKGRSENWPPAPPKR
jgi:hypothetical protein